MQLGRRRRRGLALLLGLALLALGAGPGARSQGPFLVQAPMSLGPDEPSTYELLLPDQPMVQHSLAEGHVHLQGARVDLFADARLGAHFLDAPAGQLAYATLPTGADVQVLRVPVPGSNPVVAWATGLGLVGVSTTGAMHEYAQLAGEPVRLLAAHAHGPHALSMLLGVGPGQVVVLHLQGTGWSEARHPVGATVAVSGPAGHFFLASHGPSWTWLRHGHSSAWALHSSEAIRDMAATRLLSADPAVVDLVVIGTSRLRVYIGLNDAGDIAMQWDVPLPERDGHALSADLVPGVLHVPRPMGFLHLVNSKQVLWRLDFHEGQTATWTRIDTPPGFFARSPAPGAVAVPAGWPSAGVAEGWAIQQANRIFFTDEVFACGADASIVCDPGTGSWSCAAGRRFAPLLLEGELCAGCEDGHFLQVTGPHTRTCTKCPSPDCRACDQGGRCVACMDGRLLLRDRTGGPGTCVSACPAGSHASHGECAPADAPQAAGHIRAIHLQGGQAIMAACPTRLYLRQGLPHLSAASLAAEEPPSVLAVLAAGWLAILDAEQLRTAPDAPIAAATLPAAFPHLPDTRQLFEVGPFFADNRVGLGLVVVGAGAVRHLLLLCTLTGPEAQWECPLVSLKNYPLPALPQEAPARQLSAQVLAFGHVLLVFQPDGQYQVVRDPAAGPGHLPALATHAHGLSRQPVEWLYRDHGAAGPTAQPWALARQLDPRCRHPASDPPHPGQPWVPVALTVRPGQQELLLAGHEPAGSQSAWLIRHYPLGVGAHWRTRGLLATERRLPGPAAGPPLMHRGLVLRGRADYPGALVLVGPREVAVVLLHCPPGEPCRLGPDALLAVPHDWPATIDHTCLAVAQAPGPAGLPGHAWPALASFLVVVRRPGSAGTDTRSYLIQVAATACPGRTYGPECRPCAEACQACTGPGPDQCTLARCDFFQPADPGRCLAACPPGLHADPAGACLCHDTCEACHRPPAGGAFLCTVCRSGMARDPAAGDRCRPCHWSCGQCSAPDRPDACTWCTFTAGPPGPEGTCLAACPAGTWLRAPGHPCEPCPAGCASCTGPDACTACRPGFLPGPAAGQCAPCAAACAECRHAADACLACAPGSDWVDGMPPAGPGHTRGCVPCRGPCATCDAQGRCHSCRPGFLPAAGQPGVCTEACAAGTAFDPVRGHCRACAPGCAECLVPGQPGACTACPAGQALHVDGRCVDACPAGFRPAGGACVPCGRGCLECAAAGGACSRCEPRRYDAGDGTCQPCHASCATCTTAGACASCQPGLVFQSPDPGVRSPCVAACPAGQHPAGDRCAWCHASCALCATAADQCQACAPGYRWPGPAPGPHGTGACVPCGPGCASCTADACLACREPLLLTPAGQCVATCPAGTHPAGESCQPCAPECATCAGPRADQCTGCAAGFEHGPGAPAGTPGPCLATCPEGKYPGPGPGQCLDCHPACAACTGPSDGHCWRCQAAYLQEGMCVQDCAPGYLPVDGRCLACHRSCGRCSGLRSTECTACAAGLLALPAGAPAGQCVPACPAGHHPGPGGCVPCAAGCARCPADAAACAQCQRGSALWGAACLPACPAGTWHDGHRCVDCHASCATCAGPGAADCLTCGQPVDLWLEGACLGACPAGTYRHMGMCLPCCLSCAECHGPGRAECTACPAGRLLGPDGACVAGCPAGHYADDPGPGRPRVCRACSSACWLCDGPGPGACTACPGPGQLLHHGACRDACPAGHHPCRVTGRCEPCPAGCAECVHAADRPAGCEARCTACSPGLVLSPAAGGACQAACSPGEFLPHAGAPACDPCAGECATCHAGAGRCTACADPAAWLRPDTNTCEAACPAPGYTPSPVERVCLPCGRHCDRCAAGPDARPCTRDAAGRLDCPAELACQLCQGHRLLLHGTDCVEACPVGLFADWLAAPPACAACHADCPGACVGPGPADCTDPRASAPRQRLALGLGIGLGLGLLLLLLAAAFFLLLRRWRARAPKGAVRAPASYFVSARRAML
ncbi:hypothetical protein H696_06064, partial [Fonticula alba]